jgi:phosphotriesterase-related protein
MLPYLMDLKNRGVQSFVECTLMYLGRDVNILLELSNLTGLHILTNTGQYKEPFLPKETFACSAEELANQWIREYEEGIDGTGIKPGFIKTAVNPHDLDPLQEKIIAAAAMTSKHTGLTIATHTGNSEAVMKILDTLERYEVSPEKWIFVHAQNHHNPNCLIDAARRGAWIEFGGIKLGRVMEVA